MSILKKSSYGKENELKLNSDELRFLLHTIRNHDKFVGEDVGVLYNVVMKLQEQLKLLEKDE